ncbi:MAG: hypothetical protein HY721_02255 [Planctomycetes bacterium]|nr:hypothetical protein [Planctomycetota bacterium]
MTASFRRFEILLPLAFNDGRPVPEELVAQTLTELEQRFGAVSCETQTIRGLWHSEGRIYRDNLVRVFVDVPESAENRAFMQQLKQRLKERFAQVDIWITSYPVDVV